jgi:diguanylate cyclase (GGDEF)-like protein
MASISIGHRGPPATLASLGTRVGVCLGMILLSSGDMLELIPQLQPRDYSLVFAVLHDSHDVLALMLGLWAAHRVSARFGVFAIGIFILAHLPYIVLGHSHQLPEIVRLILTSAAALFGIQIIAQRQALEQQLWNQARRDSLTTLLNHRAFLEALTQQLALAHRHGYPGAVLFLDLDGFKEVNDTLGHQTGDDLLRAVAGALQVALRDSDMLARVGGDEFAAWLPHADVTHARAAAERVQQALARLSTSHPIPLAASIGLAIAPDHGTTADELIGAADRAMYQAKADGRSRLHLAIACNPRPGDLR